MERLLDLVIAETASRGGNAGVSLADFEHILHEQYTKVYGERAPFDETIKTLLWQQCRSSCRIRIGNENGTLPEEHVMIPTAERLRLYCQGRLLKLNEIAIKSLDIIASHGAKGIAQSELARQLAMDPRSLFHQLKPLIEFRVIVRHPISYQRTFTYLLVLSSLALREEEEQELEQGDEKESKESTSTLRISSGLEIRKKVVEILQTIPSKTLPSTELFRLLRKPRLYIKAYQRQVAWLIKHGFVECFMASELGGVTGRILRYKRALGEVAMAHKSRPKTPTIPPIPLPSDVGISTNVALERQVFDLIDATGPRGITTNELIGVFGFSRKYAYRVAERLTGAKWVEGSTVIKLPEFFGKERRHRLFTQEGRMRAPAEPEFVASALMNRDSVTRLRRQQALLELIRENVLVELGKPLIVQLQQRLGEQDHTMDIKTLRRMVNAMEQEGTTRSLIIVLPSGSSRTILIGEDTHPDDPLVLKYIENMKRSVSDLSTMPDHGPRGEGQEEGRGGEKGDYLEASYPTLIHPLSTIFPSGSPSPSPSVSASPLPSPSSHPSTAIPIETKHREHRYQMQKSGYVYGVMQRCRLLHEHIILTHQAWTCETIPVLFRGMTLDLFLRIVGVGEMSGDLRSFLADAQNRALRLEQLPSRIREELHRRRLDRHKAIIKQLMELLVQLRVARPDNRFPSVAFHIPYQYQMSHTATILHLPTATPQRIVQLDGPQGMTEYWQWLSSLAGGGGEEEEEEEGETSDNIEEEEEKKVQMQKDLPHVYSLAMRRESWQQVSPIGRGLKSRLRKLLVLRNESDPTQFAEGLRLILTDFDIERSVVEEVLREMDAEREKARLQRTLERRAKRARLSLQQHPSLSLRRPIKPIGGVAEEEEEDPLILQMAESDQMPISRKMQAFSASERDSLRLAYVLLHEGSFRHPISNHVQWQLAESLYRRGLLGEGGVAMRTSEELRPLFGRLASSYEQNRRTREVEFDVRLVQAILSLKHPPLQLPPPPERSTEGGGESLEVHFCATYSYYTARLAQITSIKEALWQSACKVDLSKTVKREEREKILPLVEERPSILDPEQHMRKMARLQQINVWLDKPSIIPRPSQMIVSPSRERSIEVAVSAVRKVLATPIALYDAGKTSRFLHEQAPPELLDEAVAQLESSGLLRRLPSGGESSVKHRVRIPGAEFALHERLDALLERADHLNLPYPEGMGVKERTEVRSGDRLNLPDLFRMAALDELLIEMEMMGTVKGGQMRIILNPRGSPHPTMQERLEPTIQEALSHPPDPRAFWLGIEPTLANRSLLISCCRSIYEVIMTRPGISLNRLYVAFEPALTIEEIHQLLTILHDSDLIKIDPYSKNYYPSI